MGRPHFSIMINGLSQIANGNKKSLNILDELQTENSKL